MTKIRSNALPGSLALFSVVAFVASPAFAADPGGVPEGGPLAVPLPPVFVPPENPITEEKRVLGKILFWDAQLSSDNTRSCGSCHFPAQGGTDPENFPNPGPDDQYGTPDDRFTSRGLIRALKDGKYDPDPAFGLDPQATDRTAPSTLMAAHFGELFWDGRATGQFDDPETGEPVIAIGGALESQAVGPVLSVVEMAHQDRDWTEVTEKLARSVPMALGRDLPPDMDSAIAADPSYADLFEAAFGDPAISARRIGLAIATYERTLVPDQTPWDRYVAGEKDAMTPEQVVGWQTFTGNLCVVCHSPPTFTDFNFHSVGVRPDEEDTGLAGITGLEFDRGLFKTPTLRNIGLKTSFFHNGAVQNIGGVFSVYAADTDVDANPNRSLFLPIVLTTLDQNRIRTFIETALTDPRAAEESFPFDRPALYEEWSPADWPDGNPAVLAGGVAGSGGAVPRVIANIPPNIGNAEFRVGLAGALGGAAATVAISAQPPVGGVVASDETAGPYTTDGSGPGEGYATHLFPIPADPAREGETVYLQWRVDDPGAPGGVALSAPVRIDLFCNGPCPTGDACIADIAPPSGVLDLADLQAFISAFLAGQSPADVAPPFGVFDLADLQLFVASFNAGCAGR
jgi:cytochrome c peroxidase